MVAPLWVRGLKHGFAGVVFEVKSRTLMGAWIETLYRTPLYFAKRRTLMGAWIETAGVWWMTM